MKKLISIIGSVCLLVACASQKPNLLHSQQPVVNIDAKVAPMLEVNTSQSQIWIQNKSEQNLALPYAVFWFDKNGVTSKEIEPSAWQILKLAAKQKYQLPLQRPNSQSVNYRLYIRAN